MKDERFKNGIPPLAGEGNRKNSDHTKYTTNIQSPIDYVLEALQRFGHTPKHSGTGYSCTCPAHDDDTPSLSITQGEDGRVLLHCHAGCSAQAVVLAIGIEMCDLFMNDTPVSVSSRIFKVKNPQSDSDSASDRFKRKPKGNGFEQLDDAIRSYIPSLGGPPHHRWDYHDAHGSLVGVVLRWNLAEGKKTYRPVSLIDGQWYREGMSELRPLYRLPELLASSDPVIVCEGEKATDAAIACGYTATTSPHGCKAAKLADWSVFKDRDVIIIPDLDDAGTSYANTVLEQIKSAKTVRLLDLSDAWPELNEGDDLADVLECEHRDTQAACEKLNALIASTPPAAPHDQRDNSESSRLHRFIPFTVDILPEPLRSYVSQGAQALGCDPSYIALPMFSMLAGAIGNTHEITMKNNWKEPSIIWSCIIGCSGTGKSPALELATQPLRAIQNDNYIKHEAALRDWRMLKKTSPDAGEPPSADRCILDDATIEASLQLMSNYPRGMLLSRDELAGWFDFDRYSSSKSGLSSSRWLELFSGRAIQIDRRTQDPIFIRRAGMSITGGIQPGILRRVVQTTFLENGLAARMLFAMPPRRSRRWTNDDLDPKTQKRMQDLVDWLAALSMNTALPDASEDDPKPHTIGLMPDASDLYIQFYDKHNAEMEGEDEHIAAASSKLECYAPRFALIIHLVREAAVDPSLEDTERVDFQTMKIAIELVEWFKHETRRVYSMLAMDETQQENQRVIDWINQRGGAITFREFSRGLKKYNNHNRASQKLKELEKSGIGFMRGKQPSGRTQEFVLNDEYRTSSNH